MEQIFGALSAAVEGTPIWAALAALGWGVLSVVLSPCHLASIPLVVAYTGGQRDVTTRRAFTIAVVFAAGILVTIAAVGVITAALGRMLGDVGSWANWAVAGILLLLGLHFLDVIPLPMPSGPGATSSRKGHLGAFGLGFVFGFGVGPCTFAYMAPMLGVAFRVAMDRWLWGATLLLLYGIGHCAVIVVAGTSARFLDRSMGWSGDSRGATWLRRACGVAIVIAGLYLLWVQPA